MKRTTVAYRKFTIRRVWELADLARRFEYLLETFRRPDGRRWTGAELAKATGGVVHRSYVTNLRKGRIESPGYEKLEAIATAMNFPPDAWFVGTLRAPEQIEPTEEGPNISAEVSQPFKTETSSETGISYSNGEIARRSKGRLHERDLSDLRIGKVPLDEQIIHALRDETIRAIISAAIRLSNRDRELLLNITERFKDSRK